MIVVDSNVLAARNMEHEKSSFAELVPAEAVFAEFDKELG